MHKGRNQWAASCSRRVGVAMLSILCALAAQGQGMAAIRGATPEIDARRLEIEQQTHCALAPFPEDGATETRAFCVWRPTNVAANVALPTLITADGMDGIYVALLEIKPLLDSGQIAPFMVVGLDPQASPTSRAREYVFGISSGQALYRRHEHWLMDYVLDYVVRHDHADDTQLYLGGFSNGADWAWRMLLDHADVFRGAMLHSPVGSDPSWRGSFSGQRIVISYGQREQSGGMRGGRPMPQQLATNAQSFGAQVRLCAGPWGHEPRAWRQLSAAALIYMMGLTGSGASYQSALDSHCAALGPR